MANLNGMPSVVITTDTLIKKEFFITPSWNAENDSFLATCELDNIQILRMNLAEWVRQLDTVIGMMADGS